MGVYAINIDDIIYFLDKFNYQDFSIKNKKRFYDLFVFTYVNWLIGKKSSPEKNYKEWIKSNFNFTTVLINETVLFLVKTVPP